ncbi:adenosylcobinamide-GDP ribazoletransferase [Bacillus coahuilensis]|uniref:adenosylcobinamide-GDP ribazoletransferase n=1 Tax=Bacillus coahuilensis TaxID=408580 RepID=UPI000750A987|nr:adenosylcobinamide-GDP ribazoletransferase [Bacillus coahuilensis]
MSHIWKGFLFSLQFLTIIPIKIDIDLHPTSIKRSVQLFPIIGILKGVLLFICMNFVGISDLSFITQAFFLWLVSIVITGGLHLDGWMDTSDAYFSYKDPLKRLEVMKDPRVGAFGVISLIMLLSTKFIFIYEIIRMTSEASGWLIVIPPFISYIALSLQLVTFPAAKKDGMANFFRQHVKPKDLYICWIYGLIVCIIGFVYDIYLGFIVMLFVGFAVVFYVWVKKKVVKWFNGITGDVLGANLEGMELFLWGILFLFHYCDMV